MNRKFLLPWLCSAAVITVIRLLHATSLNYDATIQVQAAQNLLAGEGLTVYWRAADDLSKPLALEGLTHFSAGYSLYAALMMALGLTPAVFVKVWGAAATLAGWWAWARLAFPYMSAGEHAGRVSRFAALWIALVSPLLFTSRWGGTDIVLWAATPWILMLLTRAPDPRAQLDVKLDVLAGGLIGVCLLMRYASVFLLLYAVLVIVCQTRLHGTLPIKRLAALGAGALPAVAIQSYITFMFGGSAPGGVSLGREQIAAAGARAWETMPTLGAANEGVFFWLPGTLRFWANSRFELVALASAGLILMGVPLILLMSRRRSVSSWCDDRRAVAGGLLIVVPLFLWACGLVGTYEYIGDRRYYEPLRPLAVCIAYFFMTLAIPGVHGRLAALAWSSRAYMAAFVLITVVEIGAAFVTTPRGDPWRTAVLGAEPRPWPSFQMTYEFSQARRFVLDLMHDDPRVILVTTREAWFYADAEADRSRIMRKELCEASPQATHISGPARFLILDADRHGGSMPLKWPDDPRTTHECWPQLPGLALLRRFPDESVSVLKAEIPEGVRLELKRALPKAD